MKVVEKTKRNGVNDEFAIRERRREAARLYVEGWTQSQIAEKFGVSQALISKDLEVIRKGWEASAILDWDELKSRELAALDHQEEELWKAWYRSCEAERIRTTSSKREPRALTEGKGKDKKVTGYEMTVVEKNNKVVVKQLIGDPRFMDAITRVRELKTRILGFLKEEKPKNEVTVNVINWDQVADVRSKPDPIETRLKQLEALPSPPSPEVK